MNPDMVLYFAKQIANRHIKTEKVTIQTNGTIKNDKVKQALIILSDYFANVKNQSWMEEIKNLIPKQRLSMPILRQQIKIFW